MGVLPDLLLFLALIVHIEMLHARGLAGRSFDDELVLKDTVSNLGSHECMPSSDDVLPAEQSRATELNCLVASSSRRMDLGTAAAGSARNEVQPGASVVDGGDIVGDHRRQPRAEVLEEAEEDFEAARLTPPCGFASAGSGTWRPMWDCAPEVPAMAVIGFCRDCFRVSVPLPAPVPLLITHTPPPTRASACMKRWLLHRTHMLTLQCVPCFTGPHRMRSRGLTCICRHLPYASCSSATSSSMLHQWLKDSRVFWTTMQGLWKSRFPTRNSHSLLC